MSSGFCNNVFYSKKRCSARRKTEDFNYKCLFIVAVLSCAHAQDFSTCCSKAEGSCRDVCEKMSSIQEISSQRIDDRTQNIHKFCNPHLTEFWICMNKTIKDVVTGSAWWGRVCCERARSPRCRQACISSGDLAADLKSACRMSDELHFFECVQKQEEAQSCCSQTQTISCHEACKQVFWQVGLSHIDETDKEALLDTCEQSPELLTCYRNLTATTVYSDNSKYIPCCKETTNAKCKRTCETTLQETNNAHKVIEDLETDCGSPSFGDPFWQCFLKKDAGPVPMDVMPYDVAKLHCCYKAKTVNCGRVCFDRFNVHWHGYWQDFQSCLENPLELELSQCMEEVDAPCSLGCDGLTYCSHMNNRPTTLFRSCNSLADFNANLAVTPHGQQYGVVSVAGMELPLRNTSQCPSELWKSVACVLYVKPCTNKDQSSLLCRDECTRVVSACVDWPQTTGISARTLCDRIAAPSNENCVRLEPFTMPSRSPTLLSPREVIRAPCAGAPCGVKQYCEVNRNCIPGTYCPKYTCEDGCSLGKVIAREGSWIRVPMLSSRTSLSQKVCRCGPRGVSQCQPLPKVQLDSCRLHARVIQHGTRYFLECNPCICVMGERVCAMRTCGGVGVAPLTRLPCNCPPHHMPVTADGRTYPNSCLAKCAGATDGQLEFSLLPRCGAGACPKRCVPRPRVCLSRLQISCPQHQCENTSSCSNEYDPVCDTAHVTHSNACLMLAAGRQLAYWGPCLHTCAKIGKVCGVNGVTYSSECAAWSELVAIDYSGPCLAVGYISPTMEPKCLIDRILCPPLKAPNCLGFTAPGACCPKCGGAIRILYSKKQIDRALYATNISASVINLNNILKGLESHVKIADCVLRGYLTIETEIFVSVESNVYNPTDLQLKVCVLEAEKIADLINHESPFITSDLSLSALVYALVVHTTPTQGAVSVTISLVVLLISVGTTFIFS